MEWNRVVQGSGEYHHMQTSTDQSHYGQIDAATIAIMVYGNKS